MNGGRQTQRYFNVSTPSSHRDNKIPIFLENEDIEKVLISDMIFFNEKNYKHFIGYFYNDA